MSATATPDNALPRGGWWSRASGWSRFQAVALTVFVVGHGSMSADDFVEVGAGLHDWIADGCPVG